MVSLPTQCPILQILPKQTYHGRSKWKEILIMKTPWILMTRRHGYRSKSEMNEITKENVGIWRKVFYLGINHEDETLKGTVGVEKS